MSQAIEINGTLMLVCEWFARCTNPTLKAAKNPIVGPKPICDRCRRTVSMPESDLIDIEIKIED